MGERKVNWKSLQSVEGPGESFEERQGTAFAIFPHRAEDGRTYWLQRVRALLFYGPLSNRWFVKKWLGKIGS